MISYLLKGLAYSWYRMDGVNHRYSMNPLWKAAVHDLTITSPVRKFRVTNNMLRCRLSFAQLWCACMDPDLPSTTQLISSFYREIDLTMAEGQGSLFYSMLSLFYMINNAHVKVYDCCCAYIYCMWEFPHQPYQSLYVVMTKMASEFSISKPILTRSSHSVHSSGSKVMVGSLWRLERREANSSAVPVWEP